VATITLTPDTLDFGQVALDAGGGSVVINGGILVDAAGPGSFNLTPLFSLPSPFSLTLGTCPTTIAGGSS
jgi:hypothetical protein